MVVDLGKRGLLFFTSEPSTAHGLEAVSIGGFLHSVAGIFGLFFLVFALNWSNGEVDLCCHQVEETRCLGTQKKSAIVSTHCKGWIIYRLGKPARTAWFKIAEVASPRRGQQDSVRSLLEFIVRYRLFGGDLSGHQPHNIKNIDTLSTTHWVIFSVDCQKRNLY